MNSEALIAHYSEGQRQFETIELLNAQFTNSKLPGINLRQAQLVGADFRGGDLGLADLAQANLSNTNFLGANLKRTNLTEADLTQANLSQTNLHSAQLGSARLDQALLNQADLHESNLIWASLVAAQLQNADLCHAKLNSANLSNSELRQAKLQCADLRGANLQNANMRWADLSGADLTGADLTGAVLSGANLIGANLSGAILIDTIFVHADMTRVNLIEVDWEGADLTAAKLTGAKLYNTRPFGPNFDGMVCQWLDLSPNGDYSQKFEFSGSDIYEYFYNTAPTVELVIDSRLNTEAHSALCVVYQRLARQLRSTLPTPKVIPHRRRTSLSFMLRRDEKLFMTAYTMMFPFTDTVISHQALVEQLKSITQDCLQQPKPQMQAFQRMVTTLNQQRQKIITDAQLQSLAQSAQTVPFFQAPTRIIVTNSQGHKLTLYSNPGFSRRSLPPQETDTEKTILQIDEERLLRPPRADLMRFIHQFRWSDNYLRGIGDRA